MVFSFYCDLSTMNCNSEELENKIKEYAQEYEKINDCLFIISYDTYGYFNDDMCGLPPTEVFLDLILKDFLKPESICLTSAALDKKSFDYRFPFPSVLIDNLSDE